MEVRNNGFMEMKGKEIVEGVCFFCAYLFMPQWGRKRKDNFCG